MLSIPRENGRFKGLALKDAFAMAHGALRTLATTLFKIANDVRFLGPGPSLQLRQMASTENGTGLLHHAGKVNPYTMRSCSAMVCAQEYSVIIRL